MRTRLLPLILGVLLLLLAGCSTSIDEKKAEGFIKKTVAEQVGAEVKSVDCPSGETAKKGATFSCTVTGTDSSSGKMTVTQKDDEGNVSVSAPFIHVRDLEQLIGSGLAKQIGSEVAISCPEIIVGKKGGTFECTAESGEDTAQVDVTQTDAEGNVRYKLAK